MKKNVGRNYSDRDIIENNAVIVLITKENPSETTAEGNVEKVGCENGSCSQFFFCSLSLFSFRFSFSLGRGHDCRIYSVDSRVPGRVLLRIRVW